MSVEVALLPPLPEPALMAVGAAWASDSYWRTVPSALISYSYSVLPCQKSTSYTRWPSSQSLSLIHIWDNAPDVLFTVLMRRSMMRIANRIAKDIDAKALVTGESLAQVASQTLYALACTDAAQDLPVLRPLIGMDKSEITVVARKIGTFETSILPFEDCCTIFTPPHPKTCLLYTSRCV